MAKNVDKALEAVQLDINKEYGDGSIMRLGGTATLDVEAISTGCLSLDTVSYTHLTLPTI